EFLDAVIRRIRAKNIDIVSLDEAHRRLTGGGGAGRFVCFTFDDGYRDNFEQAYPVLKRHDCPFTVYVATDLPDGRAELWWLALETIIAGNDALEVTLGGKKLALPTASVAQKYEAWDRIYWPLRAMGEQEQSAFMSAFAAAHGVDMSAYSRQLSMSWDEITQMERDSLCTIGAHTVSHRALAKLSGVDMMDEIMQSRDIIAGHIGKTPQHFCYPFGDEGSAAAREFRAASEAGFKTAVTTRKGVVFPEHAGYLTALPRVSLNGDFQQLKYLDVFLSGAPFALWNRFRKINAA
ncbi:MAG: polysaccharide deacetylase, partial [Hyphomicrobiales bacterium]